jgi:hypothetical protein
MRIIELVKEARKANPFEDIDAILDDIDNLADELTAW